MITTTIYPNDFVDNGIYKSYDYISTNGTRVHLQYTNDAIGTSVGNSNRILENKEVTVTIVNSDNDNILPPLLYRISGGSIDGLGKTEIPMVFDGGEFHIKGNYNPSIALNNLSSGNEIWSTYTLKSESGGTSLIIFTNYEDGGNPEASIFIAYIGDKDINGSGLFVLIDGIYGQEYVRYGDNGIELHYQNENLTHDEVVKNIINEIITNAGTTQDYLIFNYNGDNNFISEDTTYEIYLSKGTARATAPFTFTIYDEPAVTSIEEYVITTATGGIYEAPENVLYNKITVNIPTQEYKLDLTKNGIIEGTDAINTSGTITPIIPDGYLINKISGKVRISDLAIDIESNGTEEFNSPNGFYSKVTVNTNVMDNAYLFPKVSLSIGSVYCDEDTIKYDESYIEACIYYSNIGDNLFYLSVDGTNYNQYSNGDDFEIPISLGKFLTKIYYKIKNVNTNNFGPVCIIELPIEYMVFNAISTPKFNITKISDTRIGIALENIELVDYNFKCNVIINNEEHIINDIDNTQIIIDIKDPYISIDSYFSKITNSVLQEGKHSQFVVDVNAVSTIEIADVEYRDPAYIYSKVPTKYYGIYLTLLKLLSDNGEQLVQDCVSACKSSSHKLIALWNMFNAACAAYLNNNEKLADLLIKTISSQLNIMYDENYDFIQHRVFIGNYTLNNKNNPNEFETVELYKLTPSEYDICSELELKFTIKQTSDVHYIMLPPELDLQYVSFGDTIKTVLFDAENDINLYKERSWRMADKDTDGTIYWYYSSAGAFNDIITIICKYKQYGWYNYRKTITIKRK